MRLWLELGNTVFFFTGEKIAASALQNYLSSEKRNYKRPKRDLYV
jgi:hypothetical protein